MTTGRIVLAALALASALAATACDLVVAVDPLGNGRCPQGTKPCRGLGKCVPLDQAETGCGDLTSCAPCALPHAVAKCENSMCAIESCIGNYDDCDASMPGCETDLAHDPQHCGDCKHKCQIENGFPGCSGRVCTVGGCNPGYTDCGRTLTTCVASCF